MPNWLKPHSFQGPLLFIIDALLLYLCIGIVHYFRLYQWVSIDFSLVFVVLVTLGGLYVVNVYHFAPRDQALQHAVRTFVGVLISGAMVAAFVYVTKSTESTTVLWRGNLPLSMFVFALVAMSVRYIGSVLKSKHGRQPLWLVLGQGPSVDNLRRDYTGSGLEGDIKEISGSEHPVESIEVNLEEGEVVVYGSKNAQLHQGAVTGLILAPNIEVPEALATQLMHIRLRGIPVLELWDFYERTLLKVPVLELKDRWFALAQGFSLLHHDVALKIKRLLDLFISALGLVILSPLYLLIIILVPMTSKGPAFYNQIRCGVNNQKFLLHKFRTMIENAETDGVRWAQPDDERITGLGRVLRKMRLDELPQLWNVLVGQMSFIGPRPERPDFVRQLMKDIPYYELRHLVKPGITGWAQVKYPYGSSMEDAKNKLEFDLYYIKNYSLALDLYILLRTIRVVFSRTGR